VESQQASANLASFNTDYIINPFNTFADHLAIALRTPSVHLLYDWLISRPNQPLHPPIKPSRGLWIVCGYGRFGRAVQRYFHYEGMPTVVIEHRPETVPEDGILGFATEAVTLREAGVDKAVGIIAGTNEDANNLSIIMTARSLNPKLYLIARQNRSRNDDIFRAADLDLVMQSNRIIVWRILPLLTEPLLGRFLRLARHHNEEWAHALLERIRVICNEVTPETWSIGINPEATPAVCSELAEGRQIRLWHLLRNPLERFQHLPCIPLLIVRGKKDILLPDDEELLQNGDQVLFCARYHTADRMAWSLYNPNVLEYVESGDERPDGYVWKWLSRWRERTANHRASG
jgi:hypothetical protein